MTYMAEDCIEMPLTLGGNKHMNVAYIFSNVFGKKNAEDTQMKYQSYKIQGSKVSKKQTPEIECKEDEDGEILCELPDQVISYKVEDLSTNKQIIDDHMATKFGEVGVVSYFVDMISDHSHKKEIGKAINNYDREV